MGKVENRRSEFFARVWDHAADDFQMQFDQRRPLTKREIAILAAIVDEMRAGKSPAEIALLVRGRLNASHDDLMVVLLQVAGLTRNKIITDLKASEEVKKSGVKVPGNYLGLPTSPAWRFAGEYLVRRLMSVLQPLAVSSPGVAEALEAVNQATYPGFIRQERAKRQGHEAESRLANVLMSCGIPFEPAEKADNPMCRDATVAGASFDVVIPSVAKPLICFKATVHTANIGQYGESKDDLEVRDAVAKLATRYPQRRPLVMALIDGVGFTSNRAGLDGVLTNADEFCQFRTLWKAVVVAASQLGDERIALELPSEEIAFYGDFLRAHAFGDRTLPAPAVGNWVRVAAGVGTILLPH